MKFKALFLLVLSLVEGSFILKLAYGILWNIIMTIMKASNWKKNITKRSIKINGGGK